MPERTKGWGLRKRLGSGSQEIMGDDRKGKVMDVMGVAGAERLQWREGNFPKVYLL